MIGDETLARCVLGLDLGARSVGWSLMELDESGEARAIKAMGVRVFEAGVEGDIEQGKDESRGVQRRVKRQQRRMLCRRARRLRKVAKALAAAGLLPPGNWGNPVERHELLLKLDSELRKKWLKEGDRVEAHLLPYKLRAAAVKGRVEPFELGRAIFHLGQRRGYKSNRKAERKLQAQEEVQTGKEKKEGSKERLGEVEGGIRTLQEQMSAAGCTYLGEYFATLDPEQARIRQRWTARAMLEAELDRIIEVQRVHHPDLLTEEKAKAIRRAVFFQRPLTSAKGLVGKCALEEGKRRAAIALPVAQRFRMLAAVNNLEIVEPTGVVRDPTAEERGKLIAALEREGGRTFDQTRELLGLRKTKKRKGVIEPGHVFNLERGGETRMPGDRTGSKLRAIFGEQWGRMSEEEKEKLVYELLNLENKETVARRGREVWGLDKEAAEKLAEVTLEDGYAAYSKPALRKLVARMEGGTRLKTAEIDVYGEAKRTEPVDVLPPVVQAGLDVRNPAVMRSLSELRKVVNGVIRLYGKAERIVIELARDLKQPRRVREEIAKRNREREGERKAAAEEIFREAHLGEPRPSDIEKWLLAKECRRVCPYTGQAITPGTLFGENVQFDIEHIIPLSISLDNRLVNKTLCAANFNRHHKHNRIPLEAFDTGSQAWEEVLGRVRRFEGALAGEKFRRFQMTSDAMREEYGDDFTARHLADTQYGSKLAAEYLGLLYGGINDESGKKRVFTSPGTVTWFLRNEWQLNAILGGREKNRSDHRHHAVDAAVIGVTTTRIVKMLSDAANGAALARRRMFAPIPDPWRGFSDELRAAVEKIVVSHRMDHRVAGPLHAETNYSPKHKIRDAKTGEVVEAHLQRVPIVKLSASTVEDIVDAKVREAVKAALNGGEPKRVFAGGANLPYLKARDGRTIPIRKVRIRVRKDARPVGKQHRERYVISGKDTLHHTVIVARQTRKGETWTDEPADRLKVHERLGAKPKQPAVQMDWGVGGKVAMVVFKGDCLEMDRKDGKGRALFVVRSVSRADITVRLVEDARKDDDVKKAGERDLYRIRSGDDFRKRKAAKVEISPIGEVAYVKPGT